MSVSARSTKAVMYSEIERLRALCDHYEQQLRATREPAPKPCATTLDHHEIGRRLAILMKRSVRPTSDGKFESYIGGAWVRIPERVVRHATGG